MPLMKIINCADLTDDFFKPRTLGNDVHEIVASILDNVKTNGDVALREYSKKFDKASPSVLQIPFEEIKKCADEMKQNSPELYDAITYSFNLAQEFAQKQRECFTDFEVEMVPGMITGQKNIPVERAGLYVPAGKFPLLSTVVMCAAPAKVAPCKEVVLCTPPRLHPSGDAQKPWADEGILAAAYICGIDKVFACGGAQSIGAMAYGTQSIPKCDVIVGPGNKFVAEAKRTVYGQVGIDMVAGPTEVLIIADDSAKPEWVAADLLAQAEHDPDAQPILVTNSASFAQKVAAQVDAQLQVLPTKDVAEKSIEKNGKIIVCDTLEAAANIANKKAPEHLELAMDASAERDKIAALCENYGSLFVGHGAAEVLGDYAAGLNHTLPTSGSARFTGGLSVRVFMKTVTTLRTVSQPNDAPSDGTKKSLEAAVTLGTVEGLHGHANAARIRL